MENLQTPEITPNIPYDIVELPSQGVFYNNRKKTLKVAYLTAADENILTSPNLSESGELMDTLLSTKILDKDIDVKNLAECDKQAIFVFLRNTAFGPSYTFKLVDPETSQEFEHTEDLSILKTKEIHIKPDNEGLFEYTLPTSGKKCKLRLLSPEDTKLLTELEQSYKDMKIKPMATKRLEKCVIELDGERDPMNISIAIHTLPLKDAQDIRKFLKSVEPGLDVSKVAKSPSGAEVPYNINFGLNFFRPFFGL
jgi:hypothetical protein|tara:strand:- start:14448 stop:15206 length:759 start_codon:yes stop_codon:yes gene_type:complete